MAFCAQCGVALADGSAFCGSCGQRTAGSSSVSLAQVPSSGATAGSAQGLATNMAAALTYVLGGITAILFLVLEPYKHDLVIRFHAMQSLFFSVACVIFVIVWSILWGILTSVAGFWILAIDVPLAWLIGLGIFCFWLFLMYQAYSQREYHIPYIGAIAARQVQRS